MTLKIDPGVSEIGDLHQRQVEKKPEPEEPSRVRSNRPVDRSREQDGVEKANVEKAHGPSMFQAASLLAEFERLEGLSESQLLANVRSAFGSVGDLAAAMRESHGVLGDFLYCGDVAEVLNPERRQALEQETARIRAFDTALSGARQAKAAALAAANAMPRETDEQVAQAKEAAGAAKAAYLDALKAIARGYQDQWLPVVRRNELMLAFKDADFGAAVEYWEQTARRWTAFSLDDLAREYYVVCNNKAAENAVKPIKKALAKGNPVDPVAVQRAATLLRKSIVEGKSYIAQRSGDLGGNRHPERLVVTPDSMADRKLASSEIVAGVGKAFYVLRDLINGIDASGVTPTEDTEFLEQQLRIECRDVLGQLPPNFDRSKAALEVSTRYYESGYAGDFAYYPAMPSIYQNFELGNVERAEAMLEMAQVSAEMAGGKQSTDFWCLQSQLEIALMRRDHRSVLELLERVLPRVTEGWHLDTCATRMAILADSRAATEGESTNVKLLRLVGKEFLARAYALYDGIAEPAEKWNAAFMKEAAAVAALPAEQISPEVARGRARTQYIRDNTFSFRMLTTSHSPGARLVVGGNQRFGGAIPNIEITRTSRRQGLDILRKLGIDANTPAEEAEVTLRDFVDRMYRYEREGVRDQENLESKTHEKLDSYAKYRFILTQAKERGDDATELFTEMQMRIGDCRPAAWGLGFLMSLAEQLRLAKEMRPAFAALPGAPGSAYYVPQTQAGDLGAHLRAAKEELKSDYRIASWIIFGNMDGKETYDIRRDEQGRPYPTADGRFRHVEDHTSPSKLTVDDDGAVARWTMKDAFYQWFYPGWDLELSPSAIDALISGDVAAAQGIGIDKEGKRVPIVPGGKCMTKEDGALVPLLNTAGKSIDFGLRFALYSSKVLRANDPEKKAAHGGASFAGVEVAPANPASMDYDDALPNPLGERRLRFASSIARKGYEVLHADSKAR